MTVRDALHTDGLVGGVPVTSGQEARLAQAATLFQAAGLTARTGILSGPAGPLLVSGTSSTSPWQYSVRAGGYVSSKGQGDGVYLGTNDALTLVTTPAPPASNSRIDLIYIMEANSAATINPDATTGPVLAVASGVAAAAPVAPTVPPGALVLAQAVVPSTATAGTSDPAVTLTILAPYTVMNGGVLPCRTSSEYPASPALGQVVFDLSLGYLLALPQVSAGSSLVPLVDTFLGGRPAYAGTAAPTGTRVLRYRDSAVVTTNGSGGFALNLSTPFPNGLMLAMLTPGDQGSGATTLGGLTLIKANCTTGSIQGVAYQPSGAVIASGTMRVNFLLEGW